MTQAPGVGPSEALASASMNLEGMFPQSLPPQDGNVLRNLGRRQYPMESTALASMGRIY